MVSKPWRYPQSISAWPFRAGKRRGGAPAPATAQASRTRSRHLFWFRGLFRYAKSCNRGLAVDVRQKNVAFGS
jgi:hypothetical protein